MKAFIGDITNQEIMKACNGEIYLIVQWLYFDACECLLENNTVKENHAQPLESRYKGQVKMFLKDFQDKFGKVF